MIKYNVGPDTLDEWDWNHFDEKDVKWIIYWYSQGSYEGSGYAIWENRDGTFQSTSLGHCSCYGPLEEGTSSIKMDYQTALSDIRNYYDNEAVDLVFNKFREVVKSELQVVEP